MVDVLGKLRRGTIDDCTRCFIESCSRPLNCQVLSRAQMGIVDRPSRMGSKQRSSTPPTEMLTVRTSAGLTCCLIRASSMMPTTR